MLIYTLKKLKANNHTNDCSWIGKCWFDAYLLLLLYPK